MVCRQVERLLIKFLEGELSGKLKEEVAAHLDCCPSCRKERDLLLESWKVLENYTAPKLKEDFTPLLMRRIHLEQAKIIKVRYKLPRFILRPLVPVLASAFVVVLVCLLFWKKPEETEVATVRPPEPIKVVTLANDKEIIQNLDVLQNVELLQNMDVVNELDMIENFDSGISRLEHREA